MNLCQETYIDVKYENATKYKVKGGYIFKSGNSDSAIDGGTLCLQVFSDKYGWVDTGSSFLPSEVISAFLWAQLESMEDIQAKRKMLWGGVL